MNKLPDHDTSSFFYISINQDYVFAEEIANLNVEQYLNITIWTLKINFDKILFPIAFTSLEEKPFKNFFFALMFKDKYFQFYKENLIVYFKNLNLVKF